MPETLTITYDQMVPRPFCAEGPYDYLYVSGPVEFVPFIGAVGGEGEGEVNPAAEGEENEGEPSGEGEAEGEGNEGEAPVEGETPAEGEGEGEKEGFLGCRGGAAGIGSSSLPSDFLALVLCGLVLGVAGRWRRRDAGLQHSSLDAS